jgi:AcrR family transcriptional regulator
MGMHPAPKRDHLLEVATVLFHRHGYHAVGLDRILEESEVSRPTLFKHFPSKDALIVTALQRRDRQARERFFGALREHPGPFRARVLHMFDLLEAWVRREDFTGCLFINATAEFADHRDPIHQAAKAHKDAYRDFLAGQAREAGVADPEALAEQLMILVDGLIVTCHVAGPQRFPARAKAAAALVVDAALNTSAPPDGDSLRSSGGF